MNKRNLILAALLLGTGTASLAADPLKMVYEPPQPTRAGNHMDAMIVETVEEVPRIEGCALAIARIDDVRPDKDTVGVRILFPGTIFSVPLYGESLRSGDARAWLEGALRASNLPIQPATEQAKSVLVSLRLAHAWSAGLNLNSQVVLLADIPGVPSVRRYHGFGGKVNNAGMDMEYVQTLNLAMKDALMQMGADLQKACRGTPL
ncbi:MAG: hypothetical protein K0S48_3602 [Ramlibacter sp.]|nr:hypothetical protein [Ramlibacter sp.]